MYVLSIVNPFRTNDLIAFDKTCEFNAITQLFQSGAGLTDGPR